MKRLIATLNDGLTANIAAEKIEAACDSLKSRIEARVLKLYYLKYLSWGGVAREIRKSVRQTMNIRADALAHITPIIEEVKWQ